MPPTNPTPPSTGSGQAQPQPTPMPTAPTPAPMAPVPAPTPAPAPITPQTPSMPVAQSGMSPVWAIAIVIVLLLAAGGAYAYWTMYMPQAAAPAENTLVSTPTPQDEVSAMESELNAEGNATFDAEVDNLENSF